MYINKNDIQLKDTEIATDLLQKLRMGNRVFGSPAAGLKKTLKKLEENKPEEDSYEKLDYHLRDFNYEAEKAKLKAGIEGEKALAEYFTKLVRLDDKLKDMIVFASLGQEKEGLDYIPDTDFLCIYGDNYLVVDAKNISTSKKVPIYASQYQIWEDKKNAKEPLIEIKDPKPCWRKQLGKDINIDSCICIINKTGADIIKNEDWYLTKPIHIVDLYSSLLEWVKDKDSNIQLKNLVTIAKDQIKQDQASLDLSEAKRTLLGAI